ncbi:antitoxin [Aeromicrobium sp.]|uniref:antitoxin n=1 Tax=Aeromicrobium sp. TaxID=1871063 RepID=UPI0030BF7E14
MGFLDKFKKQAPGLKDKAANLARTQNDKIDNGIGKAADAVNKATKGKHQGKIDSAAAKAREGVDRLAEDGGKPGPAVDPNPGPAANPGPAVNPNQGPAV